MFESLKSIVQQVKPGPWASEEAIIAALDDALAELDKDVIALKEQSFIFPGSEDAADGTGDTIAYLRSWYVTGESPSLLAMAKAACEVFEITDPDRVHLLMMAAILGGVDHDLPYHNNLHFKKVLLQLIRLIAVHNSIYSDTGKALEPNEIAMLLTAGCIHDLGHDGLGNTVKGVFHCGRLERQSFDFAEPYLLATGGSPQDMEALRTMILTTDVSPLGEATNSMNQMKAAYRFHFMGERTRHQRLNLSDDLSALEQDAKLTLMACLLHEADIATSAGLDYTVTQFETCQYREEIGGSDARPDHIMAFMGAVCQRRFLSDAGQKLFAANRARICALAEEDIRNGNEAFPKPQHTDFILGLQREDHNAGDQTIN